MENKIEKLMRTLDITMEEAVELMAFDNDEIGNEEVEKLTKSAKSVEPPVKRGRKPKSEVEKTGMVGVTTQKRKKKENPTKKEIISTIKTAIENLPNATEIDIKNPEKTIFFKMGEDMFEIDLKMKRKPKE